MKYPIIDEMKYTATTWLNNFINAWYKYKLTNEKEELFILRLEAYFSEEYLKDLFSYEDDFINELLISHIDLNNALNSINLTEEDIKLLEIGNTIPATEENKKNIYKCKLLIYVKDKETLVFNQLIRKLILLKNGKNLMWTAGNYLDKYFIKQFEFKETGKTIFSQQCLSPFEDNYIVATSMNNGVLEKLMTYIPLNGMRPFSNSYLDGRHYALKFDNGFPLINLINKGEVFNNNYTKILLLGLSLNNTSYFSGGNLIREELKNTYLVCDYEDIYYVHNTFGFQGMYIDLIKYLLYGNGYIEEACGISKTLLNVSNFSSLTSELEISSNIKTILRNYVSNKIKHYTPIIQKYLRSINAQNHGYEDLFNNNQIALDEIKTFSNRLFNLLISYRDNEVEVPEHILFKAITCLEGSPMLKLELLRPLIGIKRIEPKKSSVVGYQSIEFDIENGEESYTLLMQMTVNLPDKEIQNFYNIECLSGLKEVTPYLNNCIDLIKRVFLGVYVDSDRFFNYIQSFVEEGRYFVIFDPFLNPSFYNERWNYLGIQEFNPYKSSAKIEGDETLIFKLNNREYSLSIENLDIINYLTEENFLNQDLSSSGITNRFNKTGIYNFEKDRKE